MDTVSSDHIFDSFTGATKEDWQKAAMLELDGADALQKLAFEKGNLTRLPYYDQQDGVLKEHFQLNASSNEFMGARAWHNMPSIDVATESESNQKALSELNSGADGVIFNVKTDAVHISALLEKIEWPYCAISFTGNFSETFFKEIHAYANEKKYNVATLTGCAFNSNQLKDVSSLALFSEWKNFHPLGVTIEKKENPDEEIATALSQAVKQIDLFTDQGIPIKLVAQTLAFNMPIDEDFFLNIAKLKALRHLWQNVVAAYDPKLNVPLFIHTRSLAWNKKEYQPNANMLKSTTAALSAILGGCDAITVYPEETNNAMMTRIARNVSSVLREESHLSKVADPTAGSYFIESLTNQLSEKAWKKFLELIMASDTLSVS